MHWHELTWADVSGRELTWSDVSWREATWADVKRRELSWRDVSWADATWAELTRRELSWRDVSCSVPILKVRISRKTAFLTEEKSPFCSAQRRFIRKQLFLRGRPNTVKSLSDVVLQRLSSYKNALRSAAVATSLFQTSKKRGFDVRGTECLFIRRNPLQGDIRERFDERARRHVFGRFGILEFLNFWCFKNLKKRVFETWFSFIIKPLAKSTPGRQEKSLGRNLLNRLLFCRSSKTCFLACFIRKMAFLVGKHF